MHLNNNVVENLLKFKHGLNRIVTRESKKIEFKESFNWSNKSKYAKTMAAFANSEGGYIIFGVKDTPRDLIGLTSNNFESIDEEKITSYLNDVLSPEIIYEKGVYEINGISIGVIFTSEAKVKPVIAKKNDNDIKESDIYYRYNGRSEKIKYAELAALIQKEKNKEKQIWMRHLEKISKIGAENVAVLNTADGTIEGNNATIYIDEDIIKEIEFIKEGEFKEKSGSRTLKLIGEVKEMSGAIVLTSKTKLKGIRTRELFEAFLYGILHENTEPLEYIRALPYEKSRFMPIYFYITKAQITNEEFTNIIKSANTTGQSLLNGLVERVNGDKKIYKVGQLETSLIDENIIFTNYNDFINFVNNKPTSYRNNYKITLLYNLIRSQSKDYIYNFIDNEYNNILKCIMWLEIEYINDERNFIAKLMMKIFDDKYTYAPDLFRSVVCYLDKELYANN